MKTINNLYKKIFVLAFILVLFGSLLKICHLEFATLFLILGLFTTLCYIILGIYQINHSVKLKNNEKVLWTIGFISFSFITGLLYYFKENQIT
ncbi:hypothetical protein [Flavobacterium sp.]|uniref:hypothetical protein n=1 Tax=Flavobacterium sp. TaxID=239 RepID=UPI0033419031